MNNLQDTLNKFVQSNSDSLCVEIDNIILFINKGNYGSWYFELKVSNVFIEQSIMYMKSFDSIDTLISFLTNNYIALVNYLFESLLSIDRALS